MTDSKGPASVFLPGLSDYLLLFSSKLMRLNWDRVPVPLSLLSYRIEFFIFPYIVFTDSSISSRDILSAFSARA